MKKCAVLSALGDDRVGVADDLAATLNERGIEIEDSHITALGGRFASVMRVRGVGEKVDALQRGLTDLGASLGFHLEMKSIEADATGAVVVKTAGVKRYLVECHSPGPPGITALTGLFRKHEINIEDLETDGYQDPWSSGIAFRMKARIAIPAAYSVDTLRDELRRVERDRDLDLVIKPVAATVEK